MKIHEMIAIIVIGAGALLGVPAPARAQSEVSSDALGYYRKTLVPGFQSVSVSLVHSPVFTSKIASSTAGTMVSVHAQANFATHLIAGTEYYVEITGGPGGTGDPNVGHRFEVNEAATIAGANAILVIDTAASVNTLASVPNLAEHTLEVRSHLTLNEVFDKSILAAGTSLGTSDQLLFFDGAAYETYYILAVGSSRLWVRFGGGLSSQDNKPLYPGQGMLFNRKAGSPGVEIVLKGKVRANPFRQPLKSGFNLLSEGFPLSVSPRDRGAAPGTFVGATSANSADQIAIFNGTAYDTYYLFQVGSTIAWRKIGSSAIFTDSDIFDYRGSVFVRRINADAGYRVPLLWTP